MDPAGADDAWASAHAAEGTRGVVAQFPSVSGEEVGDFMLLEMRPKIFHRIELRGVSRQPLKPEPATAGGEERLDRLAAVNRGPIPDYQKIAGDVTQEGLQELGGTHSVDAAFVDPEEELAQGDSRDQREFVPVERLLQHRGATAGSPGSHPVGARAQSAFVDEDDGAFFPPRFFFSLGQPCLIHSAIATSFRSIARRVGC